MKINIAFNLNNNMQDCEINTIIAHFIKIILFEFTNNYILETGKAFSCNKCATFANKNANQNLLASDVF